MITCSCKITWQTKTISPIPQCLWPLKLVRWWHTFRAPYHKVIRCFDHAVLQYHVINKNHYISNTTVLMATKLGQSHISYCHQTYLFSEDLREVPTFKNAWTYIGHMTIIFWQFFQRDPMPLLLKVGIWFPFRNWLHNLWKGCVKQKY